MGKYNGNEVRWWIAEAIQALAEETDGARKDEKVREYLDFCSTFHQYSANNRLWLMYQARAKGIVPTRFAGTKTWNSLNRLIVKGSESFWVLAPKQKKVVREVPAKDPDTGEILYDPDSGDPLTEDEVVKRTYFDPVWVFDLSQTCVMTDRETGKPLEDGYRTLDWAIATNGDAKNILPLVRKLAETVKFLVEVAEIEGSALGYTDYKKIVCREDLEDATKVEVLLHEVAHNVLAHNFVNVGVETRETEAATAAYVCTKWLGLEPGGAKYLALWQQDAQSVLSCMDRALDASNKMIQDLIRIADNTAAEEEADSGEETEPSCEDPCPCDSGLDVCEDSEETCEDCSRTVDDEGNAPEVAEEDQEPDADETVTEIPETSEDEDPEPQEETPPAHEEEPTEEVAQTEQEEEEPQVEESQEDIPPEGSDLTEDDQENRINHVDIGKKELKSILDISSRFSDSKGNLEILSAIRFYISEGRIEATATDLETTAQVQGFGEGGGTFEFLAEAKDLKNFLKRLGDEIRISQEWGKEEAVFADGDVTLQVKSLPVKEYPETPKCDFSLVAEHDFEEFKDVLQKVFYSVSKDTSRPTLNSMLISYANGVVVATDSYRLAVFDTGWEGDQEVEMLLPSKAVKEILKLKEKAPIQVSFCEETNTALLDMGSVRVITRCVDGKFPKYVSFMTDAEENPIKVRLNAGDLAEAASKVDFGNIVITVDGQDLTMSSEERESGIKAKAKLSAVVSVESDEEDYHKPLSIAFNPNYLLDTKSIFDKGEPIDIRFKEPVKPTLFSQGRMRYLLMPIRL